jgi:GAF domain-containing protein
MNTSTSNASGQKPARSDSMNEARLEAARKRMAESHDPEDALEGLREIAANFLGSEEVGVFRVDQKTAALQAYWSFGIDLEKYDLRRVLGDAGLQQMMGGEYYVGTGHSDTSGKAQAFIPIRLANETVAIIAILRLLPHKHAFDKWDVELFKILSNEAGAALFGSSAHSKALATGRG